MRRRSAAALALALLLPLPGLAGEVVVKPGETLSELADRYGTSVERLMQLNGLRSPQDLWAGSRIQVPGAGGWSGGSASGSGNYTVKSGETLSEIAERYGTSVERLMQLNGLRPPQDLWAGSRIQVPGAGGTRRASAPVNRGAKQHTVQSGETLSEIADRYGISMQRLVALNGLSKPDDLMVGTTLKLRSSTPPAARPKPKPVSTAALKPAPKPAAKPAPPVAQAAPKPVAQPKPKPEPTVVVATATTATTTAATTATTTEAPISKPAPKPAAKPAAKPIETPVATATPAATTTPAASPAPTAAKRPAPVAAKPTKSSAPDWRSYGPLQVDWANWMPMGGSYVAPSLNSDGQPLYLAVNCNAKRLNATGQSGAWKTWDAPQSDFEQQLITDLCKAKGS